MNQKFFICKHCGNIVSAVKESGVPIVCCGEKMSEIIPGEVEASREKHIPEFKVEGNKVYVTVGSVEHPMIPEHYIEWVCIQTKQGSQMKQLQPGQEPKVCFSICECDEVEAVYAYCNLHSLWVAK
jgi:superoxide reductase